MSNEQKNNKMQPVVFLALVVMVIPAGIAATERSIAPNIAYEYAFVWAEKAQRDALMNTGFELVETYDHAVLLRYPKSLARTLKDSNLDVRFLTERTMLAVGNYRFDTLIGEPRLPPELKSSSDYYIVQFIGPVKDSWLSKLEALGAKIYGSVLNNAYIVKLSAGSKTAVARMREVQWLGEYQPAYKLQTPGLLEMHGKIKLAILTFEPAQVETVLAMLPENVNVLEWGSGTIYLETVSSNIPAIARIPEVKSISFSPEMKTLNNRAGEYIDMAHLAWEKETNNLGFVLRGRNSDGTYQIVGIADTGFGSAHYDFNRGPYGARWINTGTTTDSDGHGTHVAGIIMGNGWCHAKHLGLVTTNNQPYDYRPVYAGVAPEAKIVPYSGLGTARWDDMYTRGARVISNSWGPTGQAGYDSTAQTLDEKMNAKRDLLIVFAAGNDGPGIPSLTGGGAVAFNGIAVGACENYRPERGADGDDITQVVDFSSRGGPGYIHGRIKPDVITPGTEVVSVKSPQMPVGDSDWKTPFIDKYPDIPDKKADYIVMQGTSMAAPRAAGAALLIRQYYYEKYSKLNADHVLVKATMINGAVDMGYGYPSYVQGWGRVNIQNSLFPPAPRTNQFSEWLFTGSGQIWYPEAQSMGTIPKITQMDIKSARVPLKVTLVWQVPAGTARTDPVIATDLDLIVKSPTGVEYHGNIFQNSWSKPNPGTMYNTVDNVEQVMVEYPETGKWNVSVRVSNYGSSGSAPCYAALIFSADVGPQRAHQVELYTESPKVINVVAGGSAVFPFRVLNFGNGSSEVIRIEDNVSSYPAGTFTVTYKPGSSASIKSNNDISFIAEFRVGSNVRAGNYRIKIKAIAETSPSIPKEQDFVDITLAVRSEKLPIARQITKDPSSQTNCVALGFTYGGVDHLFIAYVNATKNGSAVEVVHSTDEGQTFSPPLKVAPGPGEQSDSPTNLRMTWVPSGRYAGRVFISWKGHDEQYDEKGSQARCVYSNPPYTTWSTPKLIDRNGGTGTYSNHKRTVFLMPMVSLNRIICIMEIFESNQENDPQMRINIYSIYSDNGGDTWVGLTAITSGGTGTWYFFPYGVVDLKGNPVVLYYGRTAGTGQEDRDLYAGYFTSTGAYTDWGKIAIADTTESSMFPAGIATAEGSQTNRIYDACLYGHTSDSPMKIFVYYTDWAGTGTPSWQNTSIVIGGQVNKGGYIEAPVLDIDYTGSASSPTIWLTYLEEDPVLNPYGAVNIRAAYTDNAFRTLKGTVKVTADGYPKGYQSSATLGNKVFTVYSAIGPKGDRDIFLRIYYDGWETGADDVGPWVTHVGAQPNPVDVTVSPSVELVANIDDSDTGFSTITAAEYKVTQPGQTPTWPGTPMTIVSTGKPITEVRASVSTSGWSNGNTYRLWVRGKDATNWGTPGYIDVEAKSGIIPPLTVNVTANPSEIFEGGTTATITVTVMNGTTPVTGASLTSTLIPNIGTLTTFNDKGGGNYEATYTSPADVTGNTVVTITVQASAQGNTGTGTGTVTVKDIGVLTSVTITPSSARIVPGGTQRFSAQAKDQNGQDITSGITYTWSVVPSAMGSVNPTTGQTTTFTAGTSTGTCRINVTATDGTRTVYNEAEVTISEIVVLTSVTITPSSARVVPSGTQSFSAQAKDQNGQDITSGITYTWSVVPSAMGSVNPTTGQTTTFTAGTSPGTCRINVTATDGTRTVYNEAEVRISEIGVLTSVTITPSSATVVPGGTQSFSAQAKDQNGQDITSGITYTWSVVPSAMGSVNPTTGQTTTFTAGTSPGTCRINVTATDGTRTVYNEAEVAISTLPPLTVSIVADRTSIGSGGTTVLTVTVRNGTTPVSDATVTMSSDKGVFSPSTGTTDTAGRFITVFTAPQVTTITYCNITATASKAGFVSGSQKLQITVKPLGTLRVRVQDTAGNAISDATVKVMSDGKLVAEGTTNTTGDYSVQLESGTYSVTVNAKGYLDSNVTATITAGETTTLTITLQKRPTPGFEVLLFGVAVAVSAGLGLAARRRKR